MSSSSPAGDRAARLVVAAFGLSLIVAATAPSTAATRPEAASTPSQAAIGPRAAARGACAAGAASRPVDDVRRAVTPVTSGRAAGSEPLQATAASAANTTVRLAMATAATTAGRRPRHVSVYVHVITAPGGPTVSHARALRQVTVLDRAYAGRQSRSAAVAPFSFELTRITRTTNRAWNHMTRGSRAEAAAMRALHRGDARDLNIYIVKGSGDVLGWASQPSSAAHQPKLDGMVIARKTLPGGRGGHYSAGDVAVHESGHWLGLRHTFAGRCGRHGDRVKDTPAEARASYTCPVGRNTCSKPGSDPVRNFMDYSYDSCMNHFTRGQADRMLLIWQRFRAGAGA